MRNCTTKVSAQLWKLGLNSVKITRKKLNMTRISLKGRMIVNFEGLKTSKTSSINNNFFASLNLVFRLPGAIRQHDVYNCSEKQNELEFFTLLVAYFLENKMRIGLWELNFRSGHPLYSHWSQSYLGSASSFLYLCYFHHHTLPEIRVLFCFRIILSFLSDPLFVWSIRNALCLHHKKFPNCLKFLR